MITPQEIDEQWKKDAPIDATNYEREAADKPRLHSKYLSYMMQVKLDLRKLEESFLNMRRLKIRYYMGELTKQELDALNLEQYKKNKPIKAELVDLLESDSHLMELVTKLETMRVAQYQLESILKEIASRDWEIKNSIQWHIFTQGG
jgi:hypothetical protein